jgi:hypothetical protein
MKKIFCLLLLALILQPIHSFAASKVDHGNFLIGWGDPHDISRFLSANLLDDQHTVLFTFNRCIYQPAAGLNAFPDGGGSRTIVKRVYIATYDINSKNVKIVYAANLLDKRAHDDYSELYISGVKGDKILIRQPRDYCWFDLKTGKLTPAPLNDDIRGLGYDAVNIHLVDSQGTIVIINNAAANPKWSKPSLAVKYPGSAPIVVAGPITQYYGYRGREIYYYPENGKGTAFNLDTRTYREYAYKEYLDLTASEMAKNNEPNISIEFGSGRKLFIDRGINAKLQHDPLGLSLQDIAPITDIEGLK